MNPTLILVMWLAMQQAPAANSCPGCKYDNKMTHPLQGFATSGDAAAAIGGHLY